MFRYMAGFATKVHGQALRLGELIGEAGVPPGVDKVAFTGSTEVNKLIALGLGQRGASSSAGSGLSLHHHTQGLNT